MIARPNILLLFLCGFSSFAQARTLRGLKGLSAGRSKKGASPPGSPEGSKCSVNPPVWGGTCDYACEWLKAAEAGAQAVLSEVPIFGNFFSAVAGLFWPDPENAVNIFKETIQYIDEKINDAISDVLLLNIEADYGSLVENVQSLTTDIQQNFSESVRKPLLETSILDGDCVQLKNHIAYYAPQCDPVALLAAIGNIGQMCLAMQIAKIYHHNSTVGGPIENDVNVYKATLDEWVQFYTDAASNATQRSLAWRMSMIDVQSSVCSDDGGDDGGIGCYTEAAIESITDNACYAAAGPPTNFGFVIADSDNDCVCGTGFSGFVAYYQSIISESFTDNLLPASRSLVPLWQYQTSTNMDSRTKPIPVVRAATSIMDAFVKLDLHVNGQEAGYPYSYPAAEMAEVYATYNGIVSQGQRTDRITQIDFWMEPGSGIPIQGIVISHVVGGQSTTLTIGKAEPTDDYNSYNTVTVQFEDNERIIAVGATDCGNSAFNEDASCLSLGYVFQTAYVDSNGAFQSEGRVLNPFDVPSYIPWIMAPQLAQARNSTFLPHIIAFHGWVTMDPSPTINTVTVGTKVPVWLYESAV